MSNLMIGNHIQGYLIFAIQNYISFFLLQWQRDHYYYSLLGILFEMGTTSCWAFPSKSIWLERFTYVLALRRLVEARAMGGRWIGCNIKKIKITKLTIGSFNYNLCQVNSHAQSCFSLTWIGKQMFNQHCIFILSTMFCFNIWLFKMEFFLMYDFGDLGCEIECPAKMNSL
jgi:hypothetical protein